MKKVFAIFAFLLTSVVCAGQITWETYYADSSLVGGTAYFVQTSMVKDASVIASALKTSGIIDDASILAAKGYTTYANTGTILEDSGITYSGSVVAKDDSIGLTGSYFVVILTSDNKFSVSKVEDITLSGAGLMLYGFGLDAESLPIDNYYSEVGTVFDPNSGGSDPSVPEPTVLALLALGVAGVALRRKKMA